MTLTRFFAALLGCLILAAPAKAQIALSFGWDTGTDKHEMQGVGVSATTEPHFSLNTTSRDFSFELSKRGAFRLGNQSFDLGMTLSHTGPQTVDARQSPALWIAKTDRHATAETTRALVTARTTILRDGDMSLELAGSYGFADNLVRLQEGDTISSARDTVPHLVLGLRLVQSLSAKTEFWVEGRYHTSPAVEIDLGGGRTVGHELSGIGVGFGVTYLFGKE